MDITFKCPNCEQELEVDASGAGSDIECPNCSKTITVPSPEPEVVVVAEDPAPAEPVAPAKQEKHFAVPVHSHAPDTLIQKPTRRPLDIIAKEGDKTLRIKTFKRTDCQESGKDNFDETVSAFLEKVGQLNIVSVSPIQYSYMELGARSILTDFGVIIIFKG